MIQELRLAEIVLLRSRRHAQLALPGAAGWVEA